MARKLDHVLQFQRAELVDDGFGKKPGAFENLGVPVWASKVDLSDAERWRSSEVAATVSARFMVPRNAFSLDLTPRDQFSCNAITYEITGIKDPNGLIAWLELTANARTDRTNT